MTNKKYKGIRWKWTETPWGFGLFNKTLIMRNFIEDNLKLLLEEHNE